MFDITVFAALGWEARAVLHGLAGVEPVDSRSWHGYLGDGASCRVVRTGMGAARAAAAVAAAPPSRLYLACGCAGGLVEWLRAGDLVAASSVVRLDGGPVIAAAGSQLAGWAAGRGLRLHAGPIVSSATVLAGVADKAAAAATGALVVDMESAALAAAAAARGIPFLALRVVLDHADQALPVEGSMLDAAGEVRVLRAIGALALRPGRWAALARLARQHRTAERRLRRSVALLLGAGLDAFGLPPLETRAAVG